MSVSASAENLASAKSCDGGSMCLELALEGERLCKAGDCRAGVAFFQAAIRAGTDDLRTLSAIYSQLGNAYFYLGDYAMAVDYHKHDLTLAIRMGDKLGEAKSSGNLGNTLKVMGQFPEAIACCKWHLDISRELGDRLSEGRALYNLGNVYHAQGKQLGRVGQNDPGHFPPQVRECLMRAVEYYEQNLELMRSLNDRQACGRACGNLGNTCYLLGDFGRAIKYHTERLRIAQEAGDKAAERRANSNLGNSHIFLGQFENAAEHYKRTLALAQELGDAAVEAQACYSLGNTYTLLRQYRTAEQYHSRHLAAAQSLRDRVGEGRACWSLGNAHSALGDHEKALYYATRHLQISKELGDTLGTATAQLNVSDLRKVLGLPAGEADAGAAPMDEDAPQSPFNSLRVRRQSMEQLSLIQITPDGKPKQPIGATEGKEKKMTRAESEDNPEESFFDLLSRCQSERMDDQRATLNNKENRPRAPQTKPKLQRSASSGNKHNASSNSEVMLELITELQSERMESQRAALPAGAAPATAPAAPAAAPSAPAAAPAAPPAAPRSAALPGLRSGAAAAAAAKPDDEFLDMIARVQGSRLEDQRTELPRAAPAGKAPTSTVPDEDFFSLIMRVQGGRMEDQRASVPLQENRQNKSKTSPKK